MSSPRSQAQEAEEDPIDDLFNNENDVDDEEEGENLFGDDMERDYRPQPELDQFSESGLDDALEYSQLSPGARRAAEREMALRDRMDGEDALFYEPSDDQLTRRDKRRRRVHLDDEITERGDEAVPIDILENMRGRSVKDHVSDEAVSREIEYRLKNFLRAYKDKDRLPKYINAIKQMTADNKESLEVSYNDLADGEKGETNIAYFLPEAPIQILEIFDRALTSVVLAMFPYYSRVCSDLRIRIADLPVEEDIRSLRQVHLNNLIRTTGVVTVTTGILPQLAIVRFNCMSCGYLTAPIVQREGEDEKPTNCASCQSRGPFELSAEDTIYHNYQRITIQESPNKVGAGRLPRSKEVILLGDLCDSCKPGDEIEITGVYTNNYDGSMNYKQGFPVFNTIIHANHITNKDKVASDQLTDEDVKAIRELSKDPHISDRIFVSIAPSIYGHEDIKQALALALFRGEPKNPGEKHRLRGDINVLLCGDPGTAKSQFLRYAAHTAPRAVLTTGQGASAVGLTAYVQRHPVTKEWTLEAGAMVLADKGVCLIDEFDKMSDQDRTSIHEAMEQQSISISKAGIVTSLQARCTVIAAANPIGGRYDPSRTFAENVDLTEPILSRFDVLCVVRDVVDPVEDDRLANFVVGNHMKLHPDALAAEEPEEDKENTPQIDQRTGLPLIPQDLLKKYILYAREKCHPVLSERHTQKLSEVFALMRQESKATGSVVITVRHVESMIRLAEAHAKLHLRPFVNDDDVAVATRIMLESFISTQKSSIMRTMKKNFYKYLTAHRSSGELLLYILKQLSKEQLHYENARHGGVENISTVSISESDFIEKAQQFKIENIQSFYGSDLFTGNRFVYNAQRKQIVHTIF